LEYVAHNTQYAGLLKKLALVILIAFILAAMIGWVQTVQHEKAGFEGVVRRSDFRSALTGALVIREGNGSHLYDLQVQSAAQSRVLAPYFALDDALLPYNHLPFEALFDSLLIDLPYTLVFVIWTLLMALALGLSLWLMNVALPVPRQTLLILVLAACSYGPVTRSFVLGQNSPLVLLGLCGTYAALKRGHPAWAGIALCLAALKPQVLPILLLLLVLQWHWRTLAVFTTCMVALCLAVMPVLGADWPVQYARLLLGVAGWRNTGAIDPGIMYNWRGFATTLFEGWAPALVTPMFLLLSLLSAILLVWSWWRSRVGSTVRDEGVVSIPSPYPLFPFPIDLLWAMSGVLAVLTSLHLNPHDLTLLIFPAWIITAYLARGEWSVRPSTLWLSILWAGYILPSLGDPGLLVVPSVLLMSLSAVLLAHRLTPPLLRDQVSCPSSSLPTR
jgi:hypothetical protein